MATAQADTEKKKEEDDMSNKYAGKCECGTWVEANAGVYKGFVWCTEPVFMEDLKRLACPNHVETIRKECAAADERIRQHSTYTPPAGISDDTCAKCDGDGKFHYFNGDIGVCFQCDGTGKIQ